MEIWPGNCAGFNSWPKNNGLRCCILVQAATSRAFGIDLQRISLGALIIALGLLVDDAMITVESMVTRLERGDEKEQAARFGYSSTAFPRLTGTLVSGSVSCW